MEQARRRGRLPEKVLNAPEVPDGLLLYWIGYVELSTCRPPSFGGVAPVPWTAVEQWADRNELTSEQRRRMHLLTSRMDAAMAKWESNRANTHKPARPR